MKNNSLQYIDTTVPVVILNSGLYDGLGILRSLGKLGVQAYVVTPSLQLPVVSSKFCKGIFTWNFHNEPGESTVEFLQNVSNNFNCKPVLMYTNDEIMLFVQKYGELLKEWFLFSQISTELAWSLYSKKEMFFLASKNNIPVPRSFFPQSSEHLSKMADHLNFPLLLKGIDGVLMDKYEGKKMMANNKTELLEYYEAIEYPDTPNVIIQEYIPRDDNSHWIFDGYFNEQSDCLVEFTGKKLRQYPPHFGMTTYGVCKKNENLSAISKNFMKTVGYKGIVGMDYCYDIRDQRYKVVDVNIRIAANFRLFVGTNGVDVAQAQYLDLTGQKVPDTTFREERKWIVEDKDLLASYHYIREGSLTIWSWMRSIFGIRELGYFNFWDQLPFWRMIWNHIKRHLTRFEKQNAFEIAMDKRNTTIQIVQEKNIIQNMSKELLL
ncbi:MAG: hypothetical protein ACHQLA_00095 [Ignavibacteriales bacterium]